MTPSAQGQVRRTPDRPGPGPIPDAVLRATDIVLRRRVHSLLAGDFRSARLGMGTELAQIQRYEVGDDVRHMDWSVTARTGQPHVRTHLAEKALSTWLVLDVSPSMHFGTADRRKADVAEGVALVIGHLAGRRTNKLGIVTFGEPQPRLLPPRRGRVALLHVLAQVACDPRPDHQVADGLADGLARAARVARQRGVVAIVSDFLGDVQAWRPALLSLAARHQVMAIEIGDPREAELPNVGELWLVDPETGKHLRVNTSSGSLRRRFARAAEGQRQASARALQALRIPHVRLSTEGDWLRQFTTFLRLQQRLL